MDKNHILKCLHEYYLYGYKDIYFNHTPELLELQYLNKHYRKPNMYPIINTLNKNGYTSLDKYTDRQLIEWHEILLTLQKYISAGYIVNFEIDNLENLQYELERVRTTVNNKTNIFKSLGFSICLLKY
jgi:hypothetical protein